MSKPCALEQQAQRLEHVGLVVGDEDSGSAGRPRRFVYSLFRAIMGSTRAARRAGSQLASRGHRSSSAAMTA